MSAETLPAQVDVAIVGAGLAGLACARALKKAGVDSILLEASQRVGGRVASDVVDGFVCDHGFQVLLTGYPAARRWLNMEALKLQAFPAGAMIRHGQGWVKLGDPLRHPADLFATLICPVGTLADKLRIAVLRLALATGWPLSHQGSTQDLLVRWGFSSDFVERFFRPFFGGVFLEKELSTSAAKFTYLFGLFSSSQVAVPAQGMGAIPQQLAAPLNSQVWLGTKVQHLDGQVLMTSRGSLRAGWVVLAGAAPEAALTGRKIPFHRTRTHYFVADQWTLGDYLMLGEPGGAILTLAPMRAYGPPGQMLLAASVADPGLSSADCLARSAAQLRTWFPTLKIHHLKTYDIEHALPVEDLDLRRPAQLTDSLFVCGDHCQSGSIQGAIMSGELAAEAVLRNR